MRTTGEILRKKRDELGITALKVGELAGVTQAYVTMVESNNTNPSKAFLSKIKDILHITEEEEKEIKEYEEFRRIPEKFQNKILNLSKGVKAEYNKLDSRGRRQFDELLEETTLMFNDESISDEDKEKVMLAMQEAFFIAKQKNKRKK